MDRKKQGSDAARQSQHARFLETARQLGCDEDGAAFDEKLKTVVGPKVETRGKQADN